MSPRSGTIIATLRGRRRVRPSLVLGFPYGSSISSEREPYGSWPSLLYIAVPGTGANVDRADSFHAYPVDTPRTENQPPGREERQEGICLAVRRAEEQEDGKGWF